MIEVWQGSDGKNRYRARIESKDPLTGDRRRVRGKTKTNRRAAEIEEAELIAKRNTGTLLNPKTTTVTQLWDEWIETKTSLRPNSRRDYEIAFERHIQPVIGSVRIQALTFNQVRELCNDPKLKPRYAQRVHMLLNACLTYAVNRRLIQTNPAAGVELRKVPRPAIQAWDAKEAAKFLAESKVDGLYPLWPLMLNECLRRSEALGLRWQDVDLDRGVIRIVQTVVPNRSDKGKAVIQKATKTAGSTRAVRLTAYSVNALRVFRPKWESKRACSANWRDNDLIICTRDGAPISPDNVTRSFAAIVARAKVKAITPHGLRHTGATLLLTGGIHPKIVQDRLGHSSISTTMDRYGHLTDDLQQLAASSIDSLIASAAAEESPAQ